MAAVVVVVAPNSPLAFPAQNVVELLDDLFRRAAEADEPPELNYVRKHALGMQAQGLAASSARLFSNPAGDYGAPARRAARLGWHVVEHPASRGRVASRWRRCGVVLRGASCGVWRVCRLHGE